MKLFEAWNILQELSQEDAQWRKATEGVAAALYAETFGWLAHDYRPYIEDARVLVWIKIQQDSSDEDGAYGNIGHVESDKQVVGILRTSVRYKVMDLHKKSGALPPPPPPGPNGEASDGSSKEKTQGAAEEKDRAVVLIGDRYEALAKEFVEYLTAAKRQKRTIHSADSILEWDVRLLRGNHTYEELMASFCEDSTSKKQRNSVQQRISRTRSEFLQWTRKRADISSGDMDDLEKPPSQFVEDVLERYLKPYRHFSDSERERDE